MPEPSAGSGKAPCTVLLIDEDPVAARWVRAGLQGSAFQLLGVVRAAEGLEWAARHRPALILLELAFPHADGLQLLQQLLQGKESTGCPVAVLTGDQALHRQVQAIRLGALDCACKPLESEALVAWVEATLARVRERKPGALSAVAPEQLVMLLQRIEQRGSSGTLSLRHLEQTAHMRFRAGRLEGAEYGGLSGHAAVIEIARQGTWEPAFAEGEPSLGAEPLAALPAGAEHAARQRAEDAHNEAFEDQIDTFDMPAAGRDWLPERSRRAWPLPAHFAPEAALAPVTEATEVPEVPEVPERDDLTLIDPRNPLLRLDVTTDPATPTARGHASEWREGKLTTTIPEATLQEASTDETPADQLTPTSAVPDALRVALTIAPTRAPREGEAAPLPQPRQSEAAPAGERSDLRCWIEEVGRTPLLLVIPNDRVRSAAQQAASELGFTALCAAAGREAFASALKVRPVAILTDLQLGDMDAREMVAAIRTNFLVRETPVLMLSGAELEPLLAARGAAALDPVLKGLEQALSPRVELYVRLKARGEESLRGLVEPIGIAMLLRALNAARLSGQLQLRHADGRMATLSLFRGEICGATVSRPCSAVGPLAILHVFGCAWQEYAFTSVEQSSTGGQVPLGQLSQLIEVACQQNNILVSTVYRQGTRVEDVVTDHAALDACLQQLSSPSRELLTHLAEGEPAAILVGEGKLTAGFARSVLFDWRRRAVLSTKSLRPRRSDRVAEAPMPLRSVPAPPSPRRWLVVAVAGLATVLAAASAYVIYWRLLAR